MIMGTTGWGLAGTSSFLRSGRREERRPPSGGAKRTGGGGLRGIKGLLQLFQGENQGDLSLFSCGAT